jgi:hypothetical protein
MAKATAFTLRSQVHSAMPETGPPRVQFRGDPVMTGVHLKIAALRGQVTDLRASKSWRFPVPFPERRRLIERTVS